MENLFSGRIPLQRPQQQCYLYGNALGILDVSNVTYLVEVGNYYFGDTAFSVVLGDSYAYVAVACIIRHLKCQQYGRICTLY